MDSKCSISFTTDDKRPLSPSQDPPPEPDLKTSYNIIIHKIVIMGDACVGKSALMTRLTDNTFFETYNPTMGMEFGTILIDKKEGIKQQLWDVAGAERFRAIPRSYCRYCIGAVVCFDLTNRKSLDNASTWVQELLENTNLENDMNIALVGMKSDLVSQ